MGAAAPAAPRPRPRRGPLRILAKLVLWLAGIVVGLVLVAFILLQTELGRGWLKDAVLGVLNDGFQGHFACERIGGFLPFDATIEGFVVTDPEGGLAISVPRAEADFHPLDLLQNRVHLSDIRVADPVVNIFDAQRKIPIVRAFTPKVAPTPGPPSPWVIELEGIDLGAGLVHGLVPGEDLGLEHIGVDLTLGVGPEGLTWPNLEVRATAIGGSALALATQGGPVVVRSSGALRKDTLTVERLELEAGPQRIAAQASLYIPDLAAPPEEPPAPATPAPTTPAPTTPPAPATPAPAPPAPATPAPPTPPAPAPATPAPPTPPSTIDVRAVRVDLAALPPTVRALFGVGVIEGSGQASLVRGEAEVHFALSTPLGFLGVQVGGTVRPVIGEWAGTVWAFDAVIPPGLRERLPPAIQVTRLDAALDLHGRGNPIGRRGDLVITGDVWQRAPADTGHLELEVARLHRQGGLRAAPSFEWRIVGDAFGIQPWLGVAGQPELAGELHGLWAEGRVTLPAQDRPALFSAIVDLDGALEGTLALAGRREPLALRDVDVLTTIAWEGHTSPVGHVELRAKGAAFEAATAAELVASAELELDRDGRPRAHGELRAKGLARDDVRAASLVVPYDLTIVDGFPEGKVGARVVDGHAAHHAVERAATELRVVREGSGLRVHGPLDVTGLIVDGGAARVREAHLALDWRLASLDPLDPLTGPSRATVTGTAVGVAVGPRTLATATLDLRLDAAQGLAGPLRVGGTVRSRGLASPEATAAATDLGLNLVVSGGQVHGQASLDAVDALVRPLPPAGGRRFDTIHLDVRTVASADRPGALALEVQGDLVERGQLETRFTAHVTPPSGRAPLVAVLDELRAKRAPAAGGRRDPTDLVIIEGAVLDASGWITVGKVHIGTAATGSVALSGRVHPGDGALELDASGEGLRLADWLGHVTRLTRVVFPGLPDLDGRLGFELAAHGTLAAPRFHAAVRLADATLGRRAGGSFDLDVTLSAAALDGRVALRWASDGHLETRFHLPVALHLAPFEARWDETAPVAFDLTAAIPDVRDVLAWGEEAAGHALAPVVRGQTSIVASLGGTGLAPTLSIDASPLVLGDWSGALHVHAPAPRRPERSRYTERTDGVRVPVPPTPDDPALWSLDVSVGEVSKVGEGAGGAAPARAEAAAPPPELLGLALTLPRAVFPAFWAREAGAIERILGQYDLSFVLRMPERALGELPGVGFIPDFRYAKVRARADLEVRGRYPRLAADGLVRVGGLERLGLAGDVEARFGASGDNLLVMVDVSSADFSLASAELTIPRFGELLGSPSRFRSILDDPDLRLEVDTVPLHTADLVNLDPSLGQTIETLFPYSVASAHLVAHGQKGGPEVMVFASIFADDPVAAEGAGLQSVAAEDTATAVTSLAQQAYLAIEVKRVETDVRLTLLPDSKVGAGLTVKARADVGTTALLQGRIDDLGKVPIAATMVAESFELGGLTTAVQSVLGGTSGFLTGTLDVDGTLGEPRFRGTPGLVLEPLAIPRIGFEQPVSIFLAFDGSTIRLQDPLVIEVPGKKPDETQTLRVDFAADVPSFDPKRVRLDGSVELLRYPVLATDSMQVRATGKLVLSGTAARPAVDGKIVVVDGVIAPDIAQREVRAMGLPADVHIVRGDPRPPPDTARRVVSRKTALLLDVALEIPKGSVRVEPHIVQTIGEVRALLWPYGSLQVRTVQREIGVFGTIYVPKESVYLYGKKFTVDPDSRVVFTGDMETDPQLYLTARYAIPHVDLTSIGLVTTPESEVAVRVTGSPSTSLHIDFSSDPPMDEANILSVIALEQPAGGGMQGLGDALKTQVLGAVLGMATLELTRDLVKKLPIDILRIESTSTSLEQVRVTAGKRISDRITFYTYVNFNAAVDESVYEFSGEYRLNRVFSVIGRWGDIGEYSLEGTLRLQP